MLCWRIKQGISNYIPEETGTKTKSKHTHTSCLQNKKTKQDKAGAESYCYIRA